MSKKHNILVIMGDHLRHSALSCMGQRAVQTPNMDRLASQSMRFNNCFTQSPLCSPARHALASSQYPHQTKVISNRREPVQPFQTIAHDFKKQGYRRHQIGHMHWFERDWPPEKTGYENVIQPDILPDMPDHVAKHKEAENITAIRMTTGGPGPANWKQFTGYPRMLDCLQYLNDRGEDEEPFLCWCAFSEPHPPFYPPREHYERVDPDKIDLPSLENEGAAQHPYFEDHRKLWAHLSDDARTIMIRAYYGMVALLDDYIGQILDTLDHLGLRDNTYVVLTSDHGDQLGEHGCFLKTMMYEGCTHVPLLISGPGILQGDCEALVEHLDVLPTLCELTRTPIPERAEGRSLLPWLEGRTPTEWRDHIFSEVEHQQVFMSMVRSNNDKLIFVEDQPAEYYRLETDPDELENRIDDEKFAERIQALLERHNAWRAK